jgi:hypothetical protein
MHIGLSVELTWLLVHSTLPVYVFVEHVQVKLLPRWLPLLLFQHLIKNYTLGPHLVAVSLRPHLFGPQVEVDVPLS